MLIMGESAGPEAALWIAGRIVHPGPFGRDLGEWTQLAIWL
jgi:hypothetical protein